MKAILYRGMKRNTEVNINVDEIDSLLGYRKIGCRECDGRGWWNYGPTENECGVCVDCKGTGFIYINI
jgi:hypothetical protein